MNEPCPLCNTTLVKVLNTFYSYKFCPSEININEFYDGAYLFQIKNKSIIIQYYKIEKISKFLINEKVIFSMKKRFKIINSSVQETFDHYQRMMIFI